MSLDPDDSLGIPGQRCPACNTRNPPYATACSFCGKSLEPLPGATPPPPAPSRTTGAPSRKTLPPVAATPTFDADGNRVCAWCGTASAPEAERCATCGAAFPMPGREMEYNRALLALQLDQVRDATNAAEAGRRSLNRWRWAAWAVSRIWRGSGM